MARNTKAQKYIQQQPLIRASISRSKDGRFLIHRTVISYIRPIAYYEAIVVGKLPVPEEDISSELAAFA